MFRYLSRAMEADVNEVRERFPSGVVGIERDTRRAFLMHPESEAFQENPDTEYVGFYHLLLTEVANKKIGVDSSANCEILAFGNLPLDNSPIFHVNNTTILTDIQSLEGAVHA